MSIRVVKFETRYRKNAEGKSVAADWVLIAPKGENSKSTQTWHRVAKLKPLGGLDQSEMDAPTHIDMRAKWSVIEPMYEAFKKGFEIPEDGTPLGAWSALTAQQVQALKEYGIATVEDVRDMGDAMQSKLNWPGAKELPKLAAMFLDGAEKADIAAENADLKERMAAMEEMLEEALQDKGQEKEPAKKTSKKSEAA